MPALRLHQPPQQDEPKWSQDQERALLAILNWRNTWRDGAPPFTLGGYAGTGKSTLIAHLVNECWHKCAIGCIAGKAACRLRNLGVRAQTIHSIIYQPWEDDEGKIHYRKRQHLEDADTILIDEASMVDDWIHQDLLSFELPILYVGDHGQLEPVGRNPSLMEKPMFRLENIHRQAANNPILRLAAAFREGRDTPYWADRQGRLKICPKSEFHEYLGDPETQFICGFNSTRHKINSAIRELKGISKKTPIVGERIIFLRNDRQKGIWNGEQATVRGGAFRIKDTVFLDVTTESGEDKTVRCLIDQFGKDVFTDHRDASVTLADFAYCLTAHKAQGSEYGKVVALDEVAPQWDPKRWRYTVVTRAKERLVYCG